MMGLIVGVIVTSMTHLLIKNKEFWDDFAILEGKVDKAEFKEEITQLYPDLIQLKIKAYARTHIQSLNNIQAIMQIKFKLLPENV